MKKINILVNICALLVIGNMLCAQSKKDVIDSQVKTIDSLKTVNIKLESDLRQSKSDVEKWKNMLSSEQSKLKEAQNDNKTKTDEITTLNVKITTLQSEINSLKSQLEMNSNNQIGLPKFEASVFRGENNEQTIDNCYTLVSGDIIIIIRTFFYYSDESQRFTTQDFTIAVGTIDNEDYDFLAMDYYGDIDTGAKEIQINQIIYPKNLEYYLGLPSWYQNNTNKKDKIYWTAEGSVWSQTAE
jgi:hypothetical protein